MRTRVRFAIKIAAFVAVVATAPLLVPSPSPDGIPYTSALGSLGPAAARAATTCNNKACTNAPRGLKFTCVSSAGTNCKTVNGGKDCAVSAC